MDDIKVATTDNPILIIVIFIIILVILGLIIWIVMIMVPKNNVPLFGACTHQMDCGAGLVCSQSANTTVTGSVCLNGLAQPCSVDSDCASTFVCLENTDNIKVCMVKTNPPTILNTMSNLVFDQSTNFTVTNPAVPVSTIQFTQPVTPKLQPITSITSVQNRPIQPLQQVTNMYTQNRIQVSPLMDHEKKNLTRYL